LFPNVDRLPEKSESSPELFRNVILKLRLEQVAEHVLELIEYSLLVDRVQVNTQDLKKARPCTFPE
jgi:hypothetical protein